MVLELGVQVPYAEMHDREGTAALARAAEDAGFHSLWASELYSFDVHALAPLAERVGPTVGEVKQPIDRIPDREIVGLSNDMNLRALQ